MEYLFYTLFAAFLILFWVKRYRPGRNGKPKP